MIDESKFVAWQPFWLVPPDQNGPVYHFWLLPNGPSSMLLSLRHIPDHNKALLAAKIVLHKGCGWQGRPVKIVDGALYVDTGASHYVWGPIEDWEVAE